LGELSFIILLLGLTSLFFAISLRNIPSEPPHIAVVTLVGQRLKRIKREGYRLFPFYPVIYNGILIDITKKNQVLPVLEVRTRDLAELEISVTLTWSPNSDYAIEYLNHGSEDGVRNILSDMARQRLREWAVAKNWQDALRANDEATALLVRTIAGLPPLLSKEEETEIIRKVGQGNGLQPIPQLGITLNRLNIGKIKPKGKLAEAAERWVVEGAESKGEKLEITHVLDLILQLKQVLDIPTEQAIEIVQTERGKVSKKIREIKGNISGETQKMIEKIIEQIWLRGG